MEATEVGYLIVYFFLKFCFKINKKLFIFLFCSYEKQLDFYVYKKYNLLVRLLKKSYNFHIKFCFGRNNLNLLRDCIKKRNEVSHLINKMYSDAA